MSGMLPVFRFYKGALRLISEGKGDRGFVIRDPGYRAWRWEYLGAARAAYLRKGGTKIEAWQAGPGTKVRYFGC